MPTTPITSDQWAIIQSGGYRAREYVVVCPSTVIFAARVASSPLQSVFASLAYNTVTTGAYTDIREGQAVLVSRTDNPRQAFFRGRVRKNPVDGTLYINESSAAILMGDYVWVIDTYDVAERLRKGAFVDWDVPFHKTGPMVKGMQSAYVALTAGETATFAFNPSGQALAKGATIASYAWDIPGATYTTGSSSTQAIEIEVDAPYNHWGRLTITDSNGVKTWFAFTLTAGNPVVDEDIFYVCHDPVDYSADENGYTASVNYWAGVENLLDRTRVCVVVDERYNAGSADLPNVRFVGYFTEDNSSIRGDERYGQLKDTQINLAGLLQEASSLTFPSIAVRHRTSPTAWDQMSTPTDVRIAAHVILEHSTLGNLAPIDWGVIDDTYFSGDADVGDTALMDAANAIAKEVNAAFFQDGGGRLVYRRNANFLPDDERGDLPDILPEPLTLNDGFTFNFPHVMKSQVRSVNVGCAVFNAVTNGRVFLTALAPANGSWGGQEDREIPAQLLAPSSNFQDVIDEASERAGNWLTFVNPVDTIVGNMDDGLGFLSPDNHGWYRFDIAAEDHPRGVAITPDQRWLLISISPKLNLNGTRTNQATWRLETKPAKAKIDVSVVPSVTETPLQVLPPLPSYGGVWSPDPSVNYDEFDPGDLGPFDPGDLGQVGPWPAEDGEVVTGGMPPAGCAKAQTSFRYDQNIAMGFLTVLNDPYMLTIEGSARISTAAWVFVQDFTAGMQGWVTYNNVSAGSPGDQSVYTPGAGWTRGALAAVQSRLTIATDFAGYTTPLIIGSIQVLRTASVTNGDTNLIDMHYPAFPGPSSFGPAVLQQSAVPLSNTFAPGVLGINTLGFDVVADYLANGAPVPGAIARIVYRGSGTNPFTGMPGTTALYADAFYQWELDEDGNVINVELRTGLLLDNGAAPIVPPFSSNHIYTLDFTGTGNPIMFRFSDTDYTDNENLPFTLTACGPNAGT